MRAAIHAGPSAPAFSRNGARRAFWLVPVSFLITPRSVSRSSSVNRTRYFFCMENRLVSHNLPNSTRNTNPNS